MPPTRVCPLRSPATVVPPDLPAASIYPVVKAAWAWAAAPSAEWIAPLASPGGKPVTAVPGLTPTSPETTVEPVLVTVEPAEPGCGSHNHRCLPRARTTPLSNHTILQINASSAADRLAPQAENATDRKSTRLTS